MKRKRKDPNRVWRALFGFEVGDRIRFKSSGIIEDFSGFKIGKFKKGQEAIIEEIKEWGFYVRLCKPSNYKEKGNLKLLNLEAIEFVCAKDT